MCLSDGRCGPEALVSARGVGFVSEWVFSGWEEIAILCGPQALVSAWVGSVSE